MDAEESNTRTVGTTFGKTVVIFENRVSQTGSIDAMSEDQPGEVLKR